MRIERGAQIGSRLRGQPVDDLDRPAGLPGRVLEVLAERHDQPLAVQRTRPQLEEQRAEALDRASHDLVELHQLARRHHLARSGERLEAHVDGAHHLDRIVVDVGGDPPPLLLLGVLQSLRELPALLDRPPQHVQAPSELVLGVLLRADVEHDALPVHRASPRRRARARPRRGSTRGARPSANIRYSAKNRSPTSFDRRFSSITASTSSGWIFSTQNSGSTPIPPPSTRGAPPPAGSCRSSWRTRRDDRGRRSPGCPRPSRDRPRSPPDCPRSTSHRSQARDDRREQRHARDDAPEVEPFRRRVIVAADRAEPVDRGRARRRGRVRVGRATGRRVPKLEPELRRDLDRELPRDGRRPPSSPSGDASRSRAPRSPRRAPRGRP